MKKTFLGVIFVVLCATVAFAQQSGSGGQPGIGGSLAPYDSSIGQSGDARGGQFGSFGQRQFGDSSRQFDTFGSQQYGPGSQQYGYYGPGQDDLGRQYGIQQYGVDQFGQQQYGSGSDPFGSGSLYSDDGAMGRPPYGSGYGQQQFGGGLGQQYGTDRGADFSSGRRFGRFDDRLDRFGSGSGSGFGSQQPFGGSAGSQFGGSSGRSLGGSGSGLGGTGR
jgi:hypothetical protein